MSEDRTQSPSKLRRDQAREHGQVAHSAELTGAAALLAATILLGAWGGDLAAALITLVRAPLVSEPIVSANATDVIERLRNAAWAIAWPLAATGLGAALAAVVAHQAQVRGLWAPGLIAPNVARLWAAGHGQDFATRAGRGLWSLVKAGAVLAVGAWAIRTGWLDFQRLSALETPRIATAAGHVLSRLALMLAATTVVLGLIDFGLQYRRFEAMLRTTPEEHREDQRSIEGDPALRARRRRIAREWRGDSAEVLTGASLVLTGANGLTLVLGGGPPPRRIIVRSVIQGASGIRLRRAAETANIPVITAPSVAQRLMRRPSPGVSVPADSFAELARLWPSRTPADAPHEPASTTPTAG
jgi:flagellar biosynthetic protein FlhB